MTPLHEAALAYAARGWAVFPLEPGAKVPVGGRGHLDASTNPDQINHWWGRWPNANIGVAVGPSGLCVLDVDVAEGKPGRASLAEIDGQLTDTLTQITGRGGLHVVYQRPIDTPVGRRIGFRPGLDLIGDGYIVAAPSVLKEGGQYRWNHLIEPAPLPPVLIQAATAPRPAVEKVQLIGTPIPTGGRNNALFKLGCALRDTGIGAEALARALDAENKQRVSPPLDDAEMAVLVNSVLQRVQVTRDVAIGAVVEQEVREALAPQARSQWIGNVAAQPQPPMVFYPTGYADLDTLLGGGFATRQLAGIIGPPSAGKSALVGDWLLTLSTQRPVLHTSTELPRHELFVRYAAHRMSFPWRDGMKGKVPQAAMANAVRDTRIKLFGSDDLDRVDPMGSIRAEAELMRQETGITPIIAIDYIQMLARGASTEMRHKVGELTMQARILAQELDTVVIGVFTTQRISYSGKAAEVLRAANDPTAYLGAAKESGDIEFDCATLMYLDVDKLHEGNPKPGRIAVARCRVGDVGFVGVRAQLDIGKFWCDKSAATEMSSDERKAAREAGGKERACGFLVEAVAKMSGRPWREIQSAVAAAPGMNRDLATWARDKLEGDSVIRRMDRIDRWGRKIPNSFTLVLREQSTAPGVPSEEDES